MKTYAIAQGDWNQLDTMVPFKVTVDAYDAQPTKKAGHIVFKKANTGNGVTGSEYLVVVEFGKKAAATKTTTTTTTKTTTNNTGPATPACRDDKDNDGDGLVDARDPGCHTDANASNITSYEINKTSEVNTVVTPTDPVTPTNPTTSKCYPNGCATNNPKNYNGSIVVPDGTPLNAFGFPQ